MQECLGSTKGEAAGEGGEPYERLALALAQQRHAPRQRRSEGALPIGQVAWARPLERLLQSAQKRVQWDRARLRRDELDREGQAVGLAAQLSEHLRVGGGHLERSAH